MKKSSKSNVLEGIIMFLAFFSNTSYAYLFRSIKISRLIMSTKKKHTTKERFKIIESAITSIYVATNKLNRKVEEIEKQLETLIPKENE